MTQSLMLILFSSDLNEFQEVVMKDETMVRSRRCLERQSKKCKVPQKLDTVVCEVSSAALKDLLNKKIDKGLNTDDPFRLFLWGPETKQLLTVKEEKDLFLQIQACFLPMLQLQIFSFSRFRV